jgi:hypothetical protein
MECGVGIINSDFFRMKTHPGHIPRAVLSSAHRAMAMGTPFLGQFRAEVHRAAKAAAMNG